MVDVRSEYREEGLNELSELVHDWAKSKGWWDPGRSNTFLEQCMLFVTEVSEAVEEWRTGHTEQTIYFVDGKPEGIPIELADLIIRVLDTCARYKIDIAGAIDLKMQYNLTRPYRHGDKKA